jgi:hypothetical protein
MLVVPPELTRRYEARLVQQNIVTGQRLHYQRWQRCYLDFFTSMAMQRRIA